MLLTSAMAVTAVLSTVVSSSEGVGTGLSVVQKRSGYVCICAPASARRGPHSSQLSSCPLRPGTSAPSQPTLLLSTAMPANLSGGSSEAYVLALGIGFATHDTAKLLKPQKVTEPNGQPLVTHTSSGLRNYLVKRKAGQEPDDDNEAWITKCESLVTLANDQLTCVQKGERRAEAGPTRLKGMSSTWRRSVKAKCANRPSRERHLCPAEATCSVSSRPSVLV
ncbi:Retinoid-binding protein 7 [Galemys pyrenaicus]|uniref:Retinoid-binding protein 7 n=1 Tax=Galemys pyrenaicus TaxID=202257 RepID=A0A8J6AM02_GALPY|nr:Retinoid-binding protein 7 [Galemys pyrenaicus]